MSVLHEAKKRVLARLERSSSKRIKLEKELSYYKAMCGNHQRHWQAISDKLGGVCLAGVDVDPSDPLSNAGVINSHIAELQTENERLKQSEKDKVIAGDSMGQQLESLQAERLELLSNICDCNESNRELLSDCKAIAECVPTNWCDPLLTGDTAVIKGPPFDCQDIENLLRAIKGRIAATRIKTPRSD